MAKIYETIGDGITQRVIERELIELPQGADENNLTSGSMDQGLAAFEAIQSAHSKSQHPWASKQPIIDHAKAQARMINGGDWPRGTLPINTFRAHSDEEWYWIEIVRCAGRAERMAQKGELGTALDLALTVGLHVRELQMKFDWEKSALVGTKNLEGMAAAAASRRKGTDEERYIEAQKHIVAGLTHKLAFAKAAENKRWLGSASSFRKAYYRWRKKLREI